MKKLAIIGLFLSACAPNLPSTTVMITNLAGNSGGSGTIISTSPIESEVLTNGHVCGVVKNGGLVSGRNRGGFVAGYRVSAVHDLCVLTVASDLGNSASLSKWTPSTFDAAYVSGHPHLMPTIVTGGHLSEKRVIGVLTGVRDCTEAERADPTVGFLCMLLGKLPIIKEYEAVAISPTIQPGSSGSGVYTEGGRIQAVVFAGEGDFGYGYAVPFEYVYNFLNNEVKTIPVTRPDLTMKFAEESPSRSKSLKQIREVCKKAPNVEAEQFCKRITNAAELSDLIYRGK